MGRIYINKEDKEFVLSNDMKIHLLETFNVVPITQEDILYFIFKDYKNYLDKKEK